MKRRFSVAVVAVGTIAAIEPVVAECGVASTYSSGSRTTNGER